LARGEPDVTLELGTVTPTPLPQLFSIVPSDGTKRRGPRDA